MSAVEVRLLGPVELWVDGVPAGAAAKSRRLLATLALRHGRAVPLDRLIDAVWPAGAPRSAVGNLHTYVSGWRSLLGAGRLRRVAPGYRLDLEPAELDLARFETAAPEEALALWRGGPLEDLAPCPEWAADLARLRALYGRVRRAAARGRIAGGRARDAVPLLRALAAEDPLNEETWLLLIDALRAAGERAEALAAYADARRTLVSELGVEPGEPLRALHRSLLQEGPASVISGLPALDADALAVLGGLAGLELGPVPPWVAAALLDEGDAEPALKALEGSRLVQRTGPDPAGQARLALPPLVGLAAAGLEPRAGARIRVLAGYLHLAERAAGALPVHVFGPGIAVAPRWRVPDDGVATRDPVAWFAAEREALLAAVDLAARSLRPDLAWELAHALAPWCDLGGHAAEWARTHEAALAACRAAGDPLGEAVTLRGLGQLHLYRDDDAAAAEAFGRARLLFARLGNRPGEAAALAGVGAVHRVRGELEPARSCFQGALERYLAAGDRAGEAYARGALARVHLDRGELEQAAGGLTAALRIADELGDRHRIAHLTHHLGVVRLRGGQPAAARAAFAAALELFAALGDAHGEAYCLTDAAGLEPPGPATRRLTEALDIFDRIGDRRAQADTAGRLADLHAAAGDAGLAEAYRAEAGRLAATVPAATVPAAIGPAVP